MSQLQNQDQFSSKNVIRISSELFTELVLRLNLQLQREDTLFQELDKWIKMAITL